MVGANGVDGNVVGGQFQGCRTRQANQAVLGGRVSRSLRKARFGSLAGNVDNAPTLSLFDHLLGRVFDAEEAAA